ncbi:MAG: ABC transporter permease subunit [Oligoflexia bacterium]|nr:ABC transporter permease subunit [Oligoflexia bacterium]
MLSVLMTNTFLKEIRNKSLIFLGLLNIAIVIVISVIIKSLGESTLAQDGLNFVGGGALGIYFLCINFWIVFLAYLIGSNTIASDLNSKIVNQLVSFPISRWQYILVRALGAWLIILAFYFLSYFVGGLVFSGVTGVEVEMGKFVYAFLCNVFPLLAAVLVSMFFSLYLNRTFTFVTCIFVSFIVRTSTGFVSKMGLERMLEDFSFLKGLGLVFHYLFPHISSWSGYANSNLFNSETNFALASESVHLVVMILLWSLLINIIFNRKEL